MAKIVKNKNNSKVVDLSEAMAKNKNVDDKHVQVKLSLREQEEERVSDVQKDNLTEELESFPPVLKGTVNVCGVYTFDMGDFIEAKVFIRNGLDRPINLGEVPLMMLDKDGEVIAYQDFNFEEMGSLPAYSARPWKLNFEKKNVFVDKIPQEGWKIGFDNRLKTVEYANIEFENLSDDISFENRLVLDNFLAGLPKLERGDVSASKFSMGISENGDMMITFVIRNARNNPVVVNKFPLTVKNEQGHTAFNAEFDLNNLTIGANKARLVNLVYKTGLTVDKDMDLTNWTLSFE